ncbi:MAG: bifunctional demethylmenaquinone methyltransferase/2-methoxy-6-polyprenyl-1,4-benzoquinol methylase UbiE [Bacteroidetes bacterium]|nr:MAG: bifunctional demethylmenaquinone methyltransferase/2-methoxy-6-polyprenyl-1,4-benzoquinol methylase UbiE [Bacteroidota bacterium]
MPKKNVDVEGLFNRVAHRYDRLNRVISLGQDTRWRRVCVDRVAKDSPQNVLDLACGTGDLTIALAHRMPVASIIGTDFSEEMLGVAEHKIAQRGLASDIDLYRTAAEQLPFDAASFDAITCAFGVRNFADIYQAMSECHRVLRPGGHMAILEFAQPIRPFRRLLFQLYTYTVLPLMGLLFAGAYHEYLYLPKSIVAFSRAQVLFRALNQAGFKQATVRRMNLGSVILVYVQA